MYSEKINQYRAIYKELYAAMKWKVSDRRTLMAIASLYVMSKKEFHFDAFIQLADRIKARAGFFSPMKSTSRFTTAATLDIKFDRPENQINNLFVFYDKLRKAKFSSGVYTYLAASTLLTHADHRENEEQMIVRAKEIYDGMKKEHPFLTSASDYPLAVLLAYDNHNSIIEQIERYYESLSKNGFRKGNDLQFLSHILSLDTNTSVDRLVSRTTTIMDSFRDAGIRPRPMYYPIIGMLSLLPEEQFQMHEISRMFDQLNNEKSFRWQKDMNLITAVSFYVNEKIDNKSLAATTLQTTLESILQAQQAVMIATIASTTAASNAANNSTN
ncbi:DUF4003 family protein [Oceanobacillus polygoni]|uniref:DUF4003 domain-containing protein n=1 Tax=Oceanobacillus polygoni TaxID=1235259 RepID=A0A9X0YP76_9BACI|nr:DUF4003 family protein [Oceanobacillus polygoni]MBP2076277.1 hypothetical protein [Oceanobacillus polygoni]